MSQMKLSLHTYTLKKLLRFSLKLFKLLARYNKIDECFDQSENISRFVINRNMVRVVNNSGDNISVTLSSKSTPFGDTDAIYLSRLGGDESYSRFGREQILIVNKRFGWYANSIGKYTEIVVEDDGVHIYATDHHTWWDTTGMSAPEFKKELSLEKTTALLIPIIKVLKSW